MRYDGIPDQLGLYDPRFEHDACGIGFVVNFKGNKSHDIIEQALQVLNNLTHRGGVGAEDNTGDGAGILTQIPHEFFVNELSKQGVSLPMESDYAVGMIFMSEDQSVNSKVVERFERIVREEGQNIIAWRLLQNDDSMLGSSAKVSKPLIKQCFIQKNSNITNKMDFERRLYVIRRRAENEIRYSENPIDGKFYVASLSSSTVVYKGMLLPEQIKVFYNDLNSPLFKTAIALVHSRYSTNTFPSWERAHPNRFIIHNGEINTIRGNINWMKAREFSFASETFGSDLKKVLPVINQDGSDSAMADNALEFLMLNGRDLPHAVMMMIPEPWSHHKEMNENKKSFYKYHSTIMEPWDGPAAIAFTDGTLVGACLDRNGFRPSRYYITEDDMVILASEVGVLDIDDSKIIAKKRLQPGKMLLIDTKEGRIINDTEIKERYSNEKDYSGWIKNNIKEIDDLKLCSSVISENYSSQKLLRLQKAFGYTLEDIKKVLIPMSVDGAESIGAMGADMPLAVLSDKQQNLFNYFKQLFAQVTNPPLDAIREEIVTATELYLGSQGNLLSKELKDNKQIMIHYPVLTNEQLMKLYSLEDEELKTGKISILFKSADKGQGLQQSLDRILDEVDNMLGNNVKILILSDRGINEELAAVPSLLAVSAVHQHLLEKGTRSKVSIVLESAEPREVHHFACLLGYGATAVNPYLAFDSINDLIQRKIISDINLKDAVKNYIKAVTKGIIKIMSKMGISTIQSYYGAQIFEAIGLGQEVVDKYFTNTPSRIGGLGIDEIAEEAIIKHKAAFDDLAVLEGLESGGQYQWRKNGEYHMYNPESIHKLQQAVRLGDYNIFKEYSALINDPSKNMCTLRSVMDFKDCNPIPIDEVESVDSIVKKFKIGAMSYGSLSKEAHETMAIAMNRLGGKSNTGEGGEDPARYIPDENGDSRSSAIKQVASGRFGVSINYLVNAKEIQIKIAQGAKPGEGGQLPGKKVYPWVAKTRYSTPGVALISPPPHHDIYSIEDLAQLIHDLKNANRDARINVKLVSEVGVGTIAAGVAKGRADVILISGYDGGTGASPRTSIKHAGLPWELGLAETHQTLVLNNLRSRVVLETDGKLMTGRDVAIAALLGAEEFGFATAPLVAMGCVMMRVCNLDTCPVGVATQNPELRKRFAGKPEHVMNLMKFIAEELREIMAKLGFRTLDEMTGRVDKLKINESILNWKSKKLDFSKIFDLNILEMYNSQRAKETQNHGIEKSLDMRVLLDLVKPAIENGQDVYETVAIKNTDRVVGTVVGSELTKVYGEEGLKDDTINLTFKGSAGQSFGAFVPKGMTLTLEGDANDYIGKGLSGGKLIVYPPKESGFIANENIIVGNVALYGATRGEAYFRGVAGERFCVRNSGATAVVEGVGDHGCEYMTGGKAVILGEVGRNFAAGMSGGIAYVYCDKQLFQTRCNTEMVSLLPVSDEKEQKELKHIIQQHFEHTGSDVAKGILVDWKNSVQKFIKVMPNDYARMLKCIENAEKLGLSGEEALIAAFEENNGTFKKASNN